MLNAFCSILCVWLAVTACHLASFESELLLQTHAPTRRLCLTLFLSLLFCSFTPLAFNFVSKSWLLGKIMHAYSNMWYHNKHICYVAWDFFRILFLGRLGSISTFLESWVRWCMRISYVFECWAESDVLTLIYLEIIRIFKMIQIKRMVYTSFDYLEVGL
jgi:hypothetical protein